MRRHLLLLATLAFACNHSSASNGTTPPDAVAPQVEAASEAAAPHPSAARAPREAGATHLPPPCRVTGVEGTATATPLAGPAKAGVEGAGIALKPSTELLDDVWVDVGKASRFTTRDASSTRETIYAGPGRFRACIDHKEDAWVSTGTFESIGGAGERPGGEEWVATPLGAARYDVAKWKITVKDNAVEVTVGSGTGYLWPAIGVTVKTYSEAGAPPAVADDGWLRLDGATGATLTSPRPVLNNEGAGAALVRCVETAGQARVLARTLAEPDASVGDVGPKHVVARKQAHAACEVAALRVASLPPSPGRDILATKVKNADADWRNIGPDDPAVAP
jgi:hypothetical protein